MQLRHIIKVHSVNTGNQGKWDEDRCNRRENAHDFVGAVGNGGLISFTQVAYQLAKCIKVLGYFNGVLMDIAKILLQLIVNKPLILLVEHIDNFLLRTKHFLQP